jgi:hypothetical protein
VPIAGQTCRGAHLWAPHGLHQVRHGSGDLRPNYRETEKMREASITRLGVEHGTSDRGLCSTKRCFERRNLDRNSIARRTSLRLSNRLSQSNRKGFPALEEPKSRELQWDLEWSEAKRGIEGAVDMVRIS